MYVAMILSVSPKLSGTNVRTLSGYYRSGEIFFTLQSTSNRLDVHVTNISSQLVSGGANLLGYTSLADISNAVSFLLTDFASSLTKSRLRLTAV